MTERQPELFKEFSEEKKIQKGKVFKNIATERKLTISITYDKIIVVILSLAVLCGTFYVIGVERGRRLSIGEIKDSATLDIANTNTGTGIAKKQNQKRTKKTISGLKETVAKKSSLKGRKLYTIQIATFKSFSLAKKEAQKVESSGEPVKIVSKKGYYKIYVGRFKTKKEAKSLLNKLKETYKDCFIRRIKN